MFQTEFVEKLEIRILFPPPLKSCRLWDNVEKYRKGGSATDDNMAHAHCMLDT